MNLTYWLRKTPQPAVVLADDKRIDVPKNARAYRDLTETIKALDPSKLTCLDANGNVIRSITLESEDEIEKTPTEPLTPEQSDLQLFATLLSAAYEKGASANQPLLDNAMQFVERQGQRLAKAESEIERLRGHIHRLNMQIAQLSNAPAGQSADDSIFGTVLAGIAQGAAASASTALVPPTPITKPGVKK